MKPALIALELRTAGSFRRRSAAADVLPTFRRRLLDEARRRITEARLVRLQGRVLA
jgi:hypothetical protein